MKKRAALILSCIAVAALVCLFFFTDIFSSEEARDAAARENPKFWKYASEVYGCDNLYVLDDGLFAGKPYNNLYLFGDDILLVGEAYYDDAISAELSDPEELVYEYSFEVYSPWRNRILHSLRHQDITCDSYQVVGDLLFLFSDETKELSIYDTSLQLTGVYDISSIYDSCSLEFYATDDPAVYYTYDISADVFLQVAFTDGSVDISPFASPYYGTVIGSGSSSGGLLAVSGIDTTALGFRLAVLDSDSLLTQYEFPGCGSFTGDVSQNAFIGKSNESEGYWVYQSFDGEPSYFQLSDIQQAFLLPDGSFILEQEDYERSVSDYIVSYYRYGADGAAISSFSYSCGDYSQPDCTFLSFGLAFFPEEQLCFILAYNINCEPYLLVWDTSVSDGGESDLTLYSSEEALSVSAPSLYYEEYENQTGLTYGSTVTLIEDEASYDWGELAQANEKADALEELYGISIYIGPEVPDMIDCFSIEQRTDADAIISALDDLEAVLSCYPQNFFKQLCYGENRGIRIYLSGTICGVSEGVLEDPSGFVNEINSYMVMVLDIDWSWNWDYTINHEFSHMIDRRLSFRLNYVEDALFSEEAWEALNPGDCEYLNSYEGYSDYTVYDQYPEYFIDSYGLTYATEDRAELFGTAMSDYLNSFGEDRYFFADTPTAEKYEFYCDCIRDGFDTTGWEDVTPWEAVLYR